MTGDERDSLQWLLERTEGLRGDVRALFVVVARIEERLKNASRDLSTTDSRVARHSERVRELERWRARVVGVAFALGSVFGGAAVKVGTALLGGE